MKRLLLVFLTLWLPSLYAQCPPVGEIPTCDAVITITDTGTSLSFTGQQSYDSVHGYYTLVGVNNMSSLPVYAIGLSSNVPIFAFDGHGIDHYGIQGNGADTTGYGGPNAYFQNIDATQSIGTVNFINPIPPFSGTDYFSLQNALLNATACSDLLNNSVAIPSGGGTQIFSSFTPNSGYNLAQAAQICGFSAFNWQQLITSLPSPSPFYSIGDFNNLLAPPAFNDPPPLGYTYQASNAPYVPNNVILPVYYNLAEDASYSLSLAANESANTLNFYDAPADNCLPGGSGDDCGFTAQSGALTFSTHLVGIVGTFPNASVLDTGIGFSWSDNFNGTNGGISVLSAIGPVDPGSGTGGIAVLSSNNTTYYRGPNRLVVSFVNGIPSGAPSPATLLDNTKVSAVTSGLSYSRVTRSFSGSVTLTNISQGMLQGPFQLLLLSLPKAVSLSNGSGSFGGSPYTTVPGTASLKPGASVTIPLHLLDPSLTPIKVTLAIYSGGFN